MPIQDILQQIMVVLRGIWRYRWYAMVLSWVLAISGWAFVSQIPNEYVAKSRVHVDTDSVLFNMLHGLTVKSNASREVAIMTKKLLSQPILERVVQMADLDIQAGSASTQSIISNLRRKIKVQASKRDNIFTISASARTPETAKDIVQSLVTIFVEDSLGGSRKGNLAAQDFLEKQVAEYRVELETIENKIKIFKQKHVGKLPGATGGYASKLEFAEEKLTAAKLQLKEVSNQRDELKRQMVGEEPVFGIMSGTNDLPSHPLDGRIAKMQAELNSLLLQYTEQHPKISAIKETIWVLKKQRSDELAKQPKRTSVPVLDKNPVYQQIKIAYGKAEAQASVLTVRVAEYQRRVNELKRFANVVPEIEAKYAELNRTYARAKKKYDALGIRLESAVLTDQVDKSGESITFEIIEPAQLPSSAAGPNRPLFNSGVLFGAIIIGLLLTFMMSQLRPTFYDQRTLRQVTGLPVFGSVSRIWTPGGLMKRRIEVGGFMSVAVLLIATYGGVLMLSSTMHNWSSHVVEKVSTP